MERVKNFWSKSFISSLYRKFAGKYFFKTHTYVASRILSYEPKTILDIACGSGDFLLYMNSVAPNIKLYGTDIAPGMVRYASKKLKDKAEIFESSDKTQPFPNEYFDVVTIMMAFHHFVNKRQALLEIKRILKPNGKLFVVDVMAQSTVQKKIWNFFEKIIGVRGYVEHYTPSDLWALNNNTIFPEIIFDDIPEMSKRYKIAIFYKTKLN